MVPSNLGHYRILRLIGAGGMGEIYLAEDTRLGRKVALKVLAPALANDPERRDRFEREARAVAALNHPNIVTLHSVEQQDGVLFLTMELVEGKALTDLIPPQGMGIAQLLDVAIPLADAVAAAHQRGITHRDLKPANVMMTDEGRVKVLDFGLAKLQQDSPLAGETAVTAAQLTGEGRIVGTFAYMSPEQAQGQPVDARSDIFSLGTVLYEMATGERPFRGDNHVSVLSAILKDEPLSASAVRQDLPRDFARILKRCLAKDPEDRYQTAKDLRNDLRLLKEDIDTRPPERPRDAVTRTADRPRRRVLLVSAIAVLALVGLWLAAAWWFAPHAASTREPFGSVAMRRLTSTGHATVAAVSPDGRYVVHVVAGTIERPSLWLRQVSTSSNVQIVAPTEGHYGALSFTPDGENILYLFYPPNTFGSVFRIPLLGGPPLRLVDDLDTVPTFSPDGRQMVFMREIGGGRFDIVRANSNGTGQRTLASRPAADAFAPGRMAWSPDGREIAAFAGGLGRGACRIVLVDAATGSDRPLGAARFDFPGQLAWMRDGTLVFDAIETGGSLDTGGQLWAATYPSGKLRRISADVSNYSSVSVTADGRALVAVQQEARASLWVASAKDLRDARAITPMAAAGDGEQGLDWTADGRIVYTARAQGSWDLWVTDVAGSAPRALTNDEGSEIAPSASGNDSRLAFLARVSGETRFRVRSVNVDGSDVRDLTQEAVAPIYLQAAGGYLFFRRLGERMATNPVVRMQAGGGSLEPILADRAALPPNFIVRRISHDGRLALGTTHDLRIPGVTMAIIPVAGGAPLRTFRYTSSAAPPLKGGFGWAPDDRAVEATLLRDGVVNLWRFPVDGSPPTQLTTFTADRILSFAWSPDGNALALSRGDVSADVVLITSQN